MLETASLIATALVGAAVILILVKLVTAHSTADRMVALDSLLLAVVAGIALNAARTGQATYLTVMVVTALLAFVGTALIARYINRRGT